jgi:EAL and modified HD-GYP domain-containing signal transduction protein
MDVPDTMQFPLVEIEAVANVHNEWLALLMNVPCHPSEQTAALQAIFSAPDVFAALAPLDCIVRISPPLVLNETLRNLLPPSQVIFLIETAALADPNVLRQVSHLQEAGYRLLFDGAGPDTLAMPQPLAFAIDVSVATPAPVSTQSGPHLAYRVNSAAGRTASAKAGFAWFSGSYALDRLAATIQGDGTSRKRLMTLLRLLAHDAHTHELEALLKQDPALSFQLFKLVNTAAFAVDTPITSFSQAIALLGRRQLQRWLQLLLYARTDDAQEPHALLPLAAQRAAQLEALCKLRGGDRAAQDLAFMTGVFSLLDILFCMSMDEIVGALTLVPEVSEALLRRDGELGELLALVETSAPDPQALFDAGISAQLWWNSQLLAYHWAIQVNRTL